MRLIFPERIKVSRRLVVVLVIQAVAIGALATGALGTPSKAKIGGPLISTLVNADHDTSVPLADAPAAAHDPGRTLVEVERQPRTSVAALTTDPVVQSTPGGTSIPGTTQSFEGIAYADLSAFLYPPDPVGDVGPTQYVQAVNGGLAVFSKTGVNLGGAVDDASFWSGITGCEQSLGDPTINYDSAADRWVYDEMGYGPGGTAPFYLCTAVSATGDATGAWYRYSFHTGDTYLPDYPKLGVWPDGYYFSLNLYGSSGFHGAGALVLDRAAMLNGDPAVGVYMDLSQVAPNQGGMLPSDADGAQAPPAGSPNYYVSPLDDLSAANNDQLAIWAFHVNWASPGGSTFTLASTLPVAAFDGNGVSVPQPNTAVQLDGLSDDRMMNRMQYRNFGAYEALVTNETVKNNNVDAPRWYELRHTGANPAGGWNVAQQSTYAPSSLNRWMGSVAMDGAGNMALGYSAGDGATFPSLRYTGRLAGDTLSTMPQGEGTLMAGGGSQTGGTRWGDYSQMTVDPTDDCTFWYTGEYYAVTAGIDWHTRIGSFRFPGCTPASPTYVTVPSISGSVQEGSTLSASPGTWSPAATSVAFQWRRCDASGLSCANIGSATGANYGLQAIDAGKRIRVLVTATTPSGTGSIVSSATATVLPLPPVNTALPVVTGTAQMGSTLSASLGTWTSAITPDYTYNWQRCTASCGDTGFTGSTYTLSDPGDLGATIRVGITATNAGGSVTVYSPQTPAVQGAPPPVNTVAPFISGTAQAGQILTAQNGTWTGVAPITYAYQWQTCSSAGTNCVPISGQAFVSYAIQNSDVGNKLRVVVTASNSGGATSVNTPTTSTVVTLAPINTVLPQLSGSNQVGAALVTSSGTWTGAVTIAYQWQRCTGATCLNIAGETTTRHDIVNADIGSTLRVAVTATNTGGSTLVYSSSSSAVPAPFTNGGRGGGPGVPDLQVTGFASATNPIVGDVVMFALNVYDANSKAATNLNVTITLPSGLQLVSSSTDRGSGCQANGANQLICNLDWLSGDVTRGSIQLAAKVTATGPQVLTAVASCLQGVLSTGNSSFALTLTPPGSKASSVPTGLNGDGATPTKTAVPDKSAPTSRALESAAKRGTTARLRFRIYDDRGVAKALATVKRNGKTVATAKTGFGSVAFGTTYYLGWHVPALAPKGKYQFCVVAIDRTGNHSRSSCAALVLK